MKQHSGGATPKPLRARPSFHLMPGLRAAASIAVTLLRSSSTKGLCRTRRRIGKAISQRDVYAPRSPMPCLVTISIPFPEG